MENLIQFANNFSIFDSAGQIARALAVFNIDEVIVFSDDKENEFAQGNSQLVNILKYLECPQYLRKDLFPIHR